MPAEAKPLVLVAEDDATTRRLIEVTVKNSGCEVLTVENGERALAAIREHRPRVAILDVQMPRLNGWEVAQALQEDPAGPTRIIFLSSRTQEDDILAGFSAGASDYLAKPFSPRELQARLRALLAQP